MVMGPRLHGLDLFSGIGGLAYGLRKYVRPVAYCERVPGRQSTLFRNMRLDRLDRAPIWDDVTTLKWSGALPRLDIIVAGFPCTDISEAAPRPEGLAGKRSGLFYEVLRLSEETQPPFIFLENVP